VPNSQKPPLLSTNNGSNFYFRQKVFRVGKIAPNGGGTGWEKYFL